MTKNTNIVIGGYYETNENKIAYLYGFNETNILYKLNNDNKGYSIEKIYNNYTYKGEGIQDIDKQFFMYPYAGIRIEFTLTTRELCQRYIL